VTISQLFMTIFTFNVLQLIIESIYGILSLMEHY
jgi:hypothetical protein